VLLRILQPALALVLTSPWRDLAQDVQAAAHKIAHLTALIAPQTVFVSTTAGTHARDGGGGVAKGGGDAEAQTEAHFVDLVKAQFVASVSAILSSQSSAPGPCFSSSSSSPASSATSASALLRSARWLALPSIDGSVGGHVVMDGYRVPSELVSLLLLSRSSGLIMSSCHHIT